MFQATDLLSETGFPGRNWSGCRFEGFSTSLVQYGRYTWTNQYVPKSNILAICSLLDGRIVVSLSSYHQANHLEQPNTPPASQTSFGCGDGYEPYEVSIRLSTCYKGLTDAACDCGTCDCGFCERRTYAATVDSLDFLKVGRWGGVGGLGMLLAKLLHAEHRRSLAALNLTCVYL